MTDRPAASGTGLPAQSLVSPADAAQAERWRQWDAFVANHPDGGFMQSSAWSRCRALGGFEPFAVILRDDADGSIVGGALVGRRRFEDGQRCFYYIQEGPLLPEHPDEARAVFSAILARIRRDQRDGGPGASHLRIELRRPNWPEAIERGPDFQPTRLRDPYREPRHTVCVDLRPDEAARLAAMRPKGRYNIGVARRHGVQICRDDSDRGLEAFIALQTLSDERHQLTPRHADYYRAIVEAFGDGVRLYFAEVDGLRLASAMVIPFGPRATYFFGASRSERRETMAPYLLHHQIMNEVREAGCQWYDFWGVAPLDQSDHPWAGISAFKRKFGGAEISHVAIHDLILDPGHYEAFRRFLDRVPVDAAPEPEGTLRLGQSGLAR